MEKKSKVVSKRLRKQLDELERSKRYDEATQLLEPIARRGNADAQYEMGELLYHKMVHEAEAVVRNQYFGQTCQGNQNYVKLISLISAK